MNGGGGLLDFIAQQQSYELLPKFLISDYNGVITIKTVPVIRPQCCAVGVVDLINPRVSSAAFEFNEETHRLYVIMCKDENDKRRSTRWPPEKAEGCLSIAI